MELLRVALGPVGTPSDVLRVLRGDPRPFLLVGAWAGGGAVAGASPFGGGVRPLTPAHPPTSPLASPVGAPPWVVGGAWVGYLGFGLGGRVERLPPAPPRPQPLPEADVAWYDHVLRMAPDGDWWFEALVTDGRREALDARLEELRARLARGGEARTWRLTGMTPRAPGHDGHRWAVEDTVRRIAEGELFQANVCLRLDGELDGDPLDVFADAAPVIRPAHGAYLGLDGDRALISFSPELFLRREGRRAWTAPIKGTAPRPPDDPAAAEAARAALAASAKDAAEHVMIVDLMRNDLGRVARYGSVTAAPEPAVEPHPGLWHLVSRVEAELREDATDADLVRAAFPPGSVTGAPKVQALRTIHLLEPTAREAYTGAIGLRSPLAGLHLNVAIRTFEVAGRHVWLGAGGGVVADSDPEAELAEALGKARPLVEALGGTVAPARPWRRREIPPLHDRPRPDPALGIMETIRVVDGVPQHVDRHLRRLRASLARHGWGDGGSVGLGPRLCAIASRSGVPEVARLRVVVTPDGALAIEVLPAGPVRPVELTPMCIPGGLGEHKWADRRTVEGLHGLIVDTDGAVLEATWANVVLLEGGRLVTPPADGRLLPGVTRERLLERGAEEDELDLARLRRADAVLLTSSIALVTPVGSQASAVAAGLRAELSAASAPSATAAPAAGPGASPGPGR